MDIFDIIKELRKGKPDINKAVKAMKVLGWICIVGAVWNYLFYYIAPFDESPFNLPSSYPYFALINFSTLGGIFLYSASGIKKGEPWGKKAGQLAVILLLALFIGFMFFMFPMDEVPISEGPFSIIFIIFLILFFAQFCVPAYYGIRYLGRLPTTLSSEAKIFEPSSATENPIGAEPTVALKYKDSFSPFGIFGTFFILLSVPLTALFLIDMYAEPSVMGFSFMPIFFFIFFTPVAYNYIPSPFQRSKSLIKSFTGGGSVFLFNGTWPFFRLLVYKDGLEIRLMFHRFFIPYVQMEADMPDKVGFFNMRGILIKSNLPGVPSGIRFQGFGMQRIVDIIHEMKNG